MRMFSDGRAKKLAPGARSRFAMMVTAGLILSAGLSAPSDLAVAAGAQA